MLLRHATATAIAIAAAVLALPAAAGAQMDHAQHMNPAPGQAKEAGQSAFAAIAEIVRILESDPKTDWSKVNLEALRQHLIDMDDVMLRATVATESVPGGARFTVTGEGRVAGAISRMLTEHASMLDPLPEYKAVAASVANGVVLTVTAEKPNDMAIQTRIRGLGFPGLLVTGSHHTVHHLAVARGADMSSHHKDD